MRWARAHAWLVLVVVAGEAAGVPPVVLLGLAAGVVLGAVRGLSPGWTTAVGVSTWAVWTGFVEHRFGQLTFGTGDLARLGLLVALGAGVSVLRRHPERPSPPWGRLGG